MHYLTFIKLNCGHPIDRVADNVLQYTDYATAAKLAALHESNSV